MKAKKFFTWIIVIILFTAAIFSIGWIQLWTEKGDSCTVMISKTSGIYEEPIVNGSFNWRWERLIPSNVVLESFEINRGTYSKSYTEKLDGADFYGSLTSTDFSYSIDLSVNITAEPEEILKLCKKKIIKNDSDLTEYCKGIVDSFALKLLAELKETSFVDIEKSVEKVLRDFNNGIKITSAKITDHKFPDMTLYSKAKEITDQYYEVLNKKINDLADSNAAKIVQQKEALSKLEELGQIVEKHPVLTEILKEGNLEQIMKVLK